MTRSGLVVATTGMVASLLLTSCGGGADGQTAAPAVSAPSVTASDPAASAEAASPAATAATTEATTGSDPSPAPAGGTDTAAPAEPAVPVGKEDGAAASAQGLDTAPTGSTGPVQGERQGEQVLFTAVRVASQNGFDRVVFEYEGDGVPSYQFSYQEEVAQQATGDPVDLPGATGLSGFISGINWGSDRNYTGPKRVSTEETRSVTVVDVGVLFEGDQDPYIGVTEEKPYRVTVLRDPTRIVVDVAH